MLESFPLALSEDYQRVQAMRLKGLLRGFRDLRLDCAPPTRAATSFRWEHEISLAQPGPCPGPADVHFPRHQRLHTGVGGQAPPVYGVLGQCPTRVFHPV